MNRCFDKQQWVFLQRGSLTKEGWGKNAEILTDDLLKFLRWWPKLAKSSGDQIRPFFRCQHGFHNILLWASLTHEEFHNNIWEKQNYVWPDRGCHICYIWGPDSGVVWLIGWPNSQSETCRTSASWPNQNLLAKRWHGVCTTAKVAWLV